MFGLFWFSGWLDQDFLDLDVGSFQGYGSGLLDLDFFGFSGYGPGRLDLDCFGFSGSGSSLGIWISVSFFRILASIVIQRCTNVPLSILFLEHLSFSFDVWSFPPGFWISNHGATE